MSLSMRQQVWVFERPVDSVWHLRECWFPRGHLARASYEPRSLLSQVAGRGVPTRSAGGCHNGQQPSLAQAPRVSPAGRPLPHPPGAETCTEPRSLRRASAAVQQRGRSGNASSMACRAAADGAEVLFALIFLSRRPLVARVHTSVQSDVPLKPPMDLEVHVPGKTCARLTERDALAVCLPLTESIALVLTCRILAGDSLRCVWVRCSARTVAHHLRRP